MRVPDNTVVYAIGDVHGCPWLLEQVFAWIAAHAAERPQERKLIILLGDIVDRGPDSRGALDLLLRGSPIGFEMICLRGNHEGMMLHAMEKGTGINAWMDNGGDQTLSSYGIENTLFLNFPSAGFVKESLRNAVPAQHRDFLVNTRFCHQEGDFLFVHAGIRPGVDIAHQSPEDMMWIRREFTESLADFGVIVVHGHTVTAEPRERINAIGLDTGAVMTGRLSCLALWDDQRDIFITPGFRA